MMQKKNVTVLFNQNPPDPRPQPVILITAPRKVHDGIRWKANKSGYHFTGLLIGGKKPPVGDFGKPVIKTVNGRSEMTVSDKCTIPDGAQMVEYKYTLEYKTPSGAPKILDPTIRHKR